MNGILVVDKPRGPTSHDVVQRARRALGTSKVGHAGTLDPMATGVLIVAVGEGTKLVPYLTAHDKEYEAEIELGAETDSLDADGEILTRADVPVLDDAAVLRACEVFVGEIEQMPPLISAIKIDGVPAHRRARRGEDVELKPRRVQVFGLEARLVTPTRISLRVRSGAGFYVRSLARDLARALGTVGHLVALRRTRSGGFGLERAVTMDALDRAVADETARAPLVAAVIGMTDAWGTAPRVTLDERGLLDARHGRLIRQECCAGAWPLDDDAVALLAETGQLVAIGKRSGDTLKVVRGVQDG